MFPLSCHQDLENFLRSHTVEKADLEELAQALMNKHAMVATVSTHLQTFAKRQAGTEQRVRE